MLRLAPMCEHQKVQIRTQKQRTGVFGKSNGLVKHEIKMRQASSERVAKNQACLQLDSVRAADVRQQRLTSHFSCFYVH